MDDFSILSGKIRLQYRQGVVSLVDRPSGTRISAMSLGEVKLLVRNLIRLIQEAEGGPFIEPTFDERATKPAPFVEIERVSGSLVDGVWEAKIDGESLGTYPSANRAQAAVEKVLRRSV